MNATITFYGGAREVTGSNFLLELGGRRMLVDCGMRQGLHFCEDDRNDRFAYDPASVSELFVTHGHLDHVGKIPKLINEGFTGTIYSTAATKDLAQAILDDGFGIMMEQAEEYGREPLYERDDIERAFANWETVAYHEALAVGDVSVRFFDAGHILGSSMIEFSAGGESVVFTGDLGNANAPLLRPTEKLEGPSYLVMESVYGNRNHESTDERKHKLQDAAKRTIERGGTLMIPAFSIERTQILLHELDHLMAAGDVPSVPVYLDSPLAISVTELYRKHKALLSEHIQSDIQSGDDIFDFPNLTLTRSVEESKRINDEDGPKIIIAGSGMSNGGRILHHEKRYLHDKKNTLLIVGYQAAGTPGRRLLEGAKEISIHGDSIPVRAEVESINGYSAHMDSDHLVDFVAENGENLKTAYLAMGELDAARFLAQRLNDELGVAGRIPKRGDTETLEL